MIQERITDMEIYLNDISNVIKHYALSQEMVDKCTNSMEESMKNSTYFLFHQN